MILLIGEGSWAKRLKEKFAYKNIIQIGYRQLNKQVFLKDLEIYDIKEVWICVPSQYFTKTYMFVRNLKPLKIISCTKGLLENGKTPLEFIEEQHKAHLGGACIKENEIIRFGGKELEIVSILKNVYAIGFAYWLEKEGINYASNKLSNYIYELSKLMGNFKVEYLNDLIATCFSDQSRNHKAGKLIAKNKRLKDNTIEGIDTARIIKEKDKFQGLSYLQETVDIIINKNI